jgi:hypothetical protein
MLIISAFIGFAILIMGRQLFWVTVAGLGFILGMNYTIQYFQGSPEIILLVSIGVGIIGAVLGLVLQRTAAGLIGFLAGWYLTTILINLINLNIGQYWYILTIIGGLIGVGLISILMDWSLILLSSLAGASIISQSIPVRPMITTAIFVILFTLGVVIQWLLYVNEKDDFKS